MSLQQVDFELLSEDLGTLVACLSDLSGGICEQEDGFRETFEARDQNCPARRGCNSPDEYIEWLFDESWGAYEIARKRLLIQVGTGDLNLLAVGEFEREKLYKLYEALQMLDNLRKPDSTVSGSITLSERIRGPLDLLALLEELEEYFGPSSEDEVKEALQEIDGDKTDGPDLKYPRIFYFEGKQYELKKRSWQICSEIWDKDGVTFMALGKSVWGDESTSGQTIKSALSRLNSEMTELGIALQWCSISECIYLQK